MWFNNTGNTHVNNLYGLPLRKQISDMSIKYMPVGSAFSWKSWYLLIIFRKRDILTKLNNSLDMIRIMTEILVNCTRQGQFEYIKHMYRWKDIINPPPFHSSVVIESFPPCSSLFSSICCLQETEAHLSGRICSYGDRGNVVTSTLLRPYLQQWGPR